MPKPTICYCTRPKCWNIHPERDAQVAISASAPAPAPAKQKAICYCKRPGCWNIHPERDARVAISASALAPTPVLVPVAFTTTTGTSVSYTNCPLCMAFVFSGHCDCQDPNLLPANHLPSHEQQDFEFDTFYVDAPECVDSSTYDEQEVETAEELGSIEEKALVEEALIDAELAEAEAILFEEDALEAQ
jgi:hypothetical protein